jgi:predicted RND superfamily exporter protein
MMLAHVEHVVDREGRRWSDHTIRVAAAERFTPVFMTALMAALGLVPLALGLGRPGHEIEAPMAITILGGMTTATFLNLVVLPEALIRMQGWLGLGVPPADSKSASSPSGMAVAGESSEPDCECAHGCAGRLRLVISPARARR